MIIYHVCFGNKQYSYSLLEYDDGKNDILFGSMLVNAQVSTITPIAISMCPIVNVKCLGFELKLR